jgi:hypothetical protein
MIADIITLVTSETLSLAKIYIPARGDAEFGKNSRSGICGLESIQDMSMLFNFGVLTALKI